MSWYEINVKTSENCTDAVSNIFYRMGANGVQIINPNDPDLNGSASGLWDFFDPQNIKLDFDGVLITGYLDIETEKDLENTMINLSQHVADLTSFGLDPGLAQVTYKPVYPEDWENEWKKYFKPFRLGKNIVVKPTWEKFDVLDSDVVIEIDPGNAFGSGTHETTSLCIEALERHIKKGDDVIDIGCGSGILTIAAGLLGAQNVIGIDIDSVAVKTTKLNVEQNKLSHMTDVRQGDLLAVVDSKADIVVANIIAEIILILADDVQKVMKPDGLFIASGIIVNKLDEVVLKIKKCQMEIVETIVKGEWAVVVSRPIK